LEKYLRVSAFVISIDFELFWGMVGSKSIKHYGANIAAEWHAVPAMIALFKQYGVHATWATVGMLMCKDYKQWCALRPSVLPTYERKRYLSYSVAALAQDRPKLFFARPLVEQILAADGQELASHTYSHFFCGEAGTTFEQFVADLKCAKSIFDECGVKPTSFVFPGNQARDEYLSMISAAEFTAYRGNQDHWLYRNGHLVPCGSIGRVVRVADAYLPLTGNHVSPFPNEMSARKLINTPASRFLRPSSGNAVFDRIHLRRVKEGMLEAARANGIFHLWWHPHNFGKDMEQNLALLESLLQYFSVLQDKHGMQSLTMADIAAR
jgi:peptidoglycan/xylan/chitin deacetylase (PgdA/CDA1 family)